MWQFTLRGTPAFIEATGCFDIEYRISVACRNGCIYTIKVYFSMQVLRMRSVYVGIH